MISVVVPTRNRSSLLAGLLAAIDAQTHPDFEVIVVDDASSDETPGVLSRWRGERRIALRSDLPVGSYAARNMGWRRARGEVVAFTDDDCLPDPDWLAALQAAFDKSDAAAAQGVTLPHPGRATPFTHQIEQRVPGPPYRTCNIAYRREVLEELGGFEPLRWYADNILGLRARQRGPIGFAPRAIVLHPPRRREWRDRTAWLDRFEADAIHRRFLRQLGQEPIGTPHRMLPLVLWVVRPLLKQSLAHLAYALRSPRRYVREVQPMLAEKRALLHALGESWRRGIRPAEWGRVSPPRPAAHLPLSPNPPVSVVIATKDRPQSLALTLQALQAQTYEPREVIIVDQSDDDAVEHLAEQYGARRLKAGNTLGAARQAGVEAAQGEIVAFTDDDCLPDPTWLERLVQAFRDRPELHGVQGRTVAERGPVGWHAVRVLRPDPLYQTCNIAYRRKALERSGGFDERFSGWFEDTALGARVERHGRIGFAADALVTHRAVPRRRRDREAWRRLLVDERLLEHEYHAFYRRVRGPGFRRVVIARWLLGSPLKLLLRELPAGLAAPREYLALVLDLVAESAELVRAMTRRTSRPLCVERVAQAAAEEPGREGEKGQCQV